MWHKEIMQTFNESEKMVELIELHEGKDKTVVLGNSIEVTASDAVLKIQAKTAKAVDAPIGIIPEYLIGEGVDK